MHRDNYRSYFIFHTVEAIQKGVDEVAKFDAGTYVGPTFTCVQYSVCSRRLVRYNYHRKLRVQFPLSLINALSQDANFGRYQITPEEVLRAMKRNSRVHTALICIGEGADAQWYVFFITIYLFTKLTGAFKD